MLFLNLEVGNPLFIILMDLIFKLNEILSSHTIAINVAADNDFSMVNETLVVKNVILSVLVRLSVL